MSSTINWVGNKVFDAGAPVRPHPQAASAFAVPMAGAASAAVPAVTAVPQDTPAVPETQQGPPPASETGYIPNYLKRNIGKNIRAEFIIGADQYTDRTGILTEVGNNYFVIHDVNSRTDIMCDLYSVKFVTILAE